MASPLLALNPDRKADSYSIRGWFTEQGLPSNKVRAIAQTRDGYLWLATAQGITRFDGSRFTNFTGATHPELRGGGFFGVLEAPDGTLWFGGDTGLFRSRDGRFEQFTTAEGLADSRVRALALTRDGAVVACTRTGFSIMRDGHLTTPGGVWQAMTGEARAYLDRADGSTILATEEGVWRLIGEKIERLAGGPGTPGRPYTSLAETPDGALWIGSSRGLRCLQPDGVIREYTSPDGPGNLRVAALQVDAEGTLWVGTYGTGLYRFARGRLEPAPYRDPLGRAVVQNFCADREGSLWIAAAPGLYRLGDTISSSIGSGDGLAQTNLYSVIEAHDGGWWLGLWGGGVYRSDGVRAERLAVPPALGLNQIFALTEAPAGTLWIGATSGLYRHAAGVTTNLYDADRADEWSRQIASRPDAIVAGIAHPRVNAIADDGEGGLWVATDGALYHGTEGHWRASTSVAGLPGNVFKAVTRTRTGDVWVSVPPDGVARLHGGQWTAFRSGDVLSKIVPRAVFEDSAGTIWVPTDGGGLNRFKNGRWRIFTTLDGLSDDFIGGLTEDTARNLWLATPRGVMRIPLDQFDALDAGRALLEPRIFNRDDGLPAAEVNHQGSPNTVRTRDGRVLIATDRGLTIIEPGQLHLNRLVPPVYLERFVVNGAAVAFHRPIVVPPGINEVQIDYTAISLLAPEKVRFKIRLAPLDHDWVDVGGRREVHYARIAAGEYTFQVIACNNDGLWNETGATLAFTVQPHFYTTPWFIGLTVLGAGLAVFAALRTRAHLSRQRLVALEKIVGERTRDLLLAKDAADSAREEIARERARFKFIFEAVPIGITWMLRGKLSTRIVNPAHAAMTGVPIEHCHDIARYRAATPPADQARQDALHQQLRAGQIDHYDLEKRYVHPDGRLCWVAMSVRIFSDPGSSEVQEISTLVDITARMAAETERETLHRQLLDISRQAGMAEVATSVLHNVGNVLNSVNVSANIVLDDVRASKVSVVARLSALLKEHEADLAAFVTNDPRGRNVPQFLHTLADHLAQEQRMIVQEVEVLQKNIEHIKEIVAMQQSYARVSGVTEIVDVAALVEDSLQMNSGALERLGIGLVRDFQDRPSITLDKHKVLQILVNLLRNAQHACQESGRADQRITLQITTDERCVRIVVADNGVGIPHENLTKIFSHGFTTRRDGHGFGLHSGALAAQELGGSLSAHSDGPGLGATFTVELPLRPKGVAPEPQPKKTHPPLDKPPSAVSRT